MHDGGLNRVRWLTNTLLSGLGKGLLGVVTKPVGGMAALVSHTSQGIINSTGIGEITVVSRPMELLAFEVCVDSPKIDSFSTSLTIPCALATTTTRVRDEDLQGSEPSACLC